jgi:hypothetical protein
MIKGGNFFFFFFLKDFIHEREIFIWCQKEVSVVFLLMTPASRLKNELQKAVVLGKALFKKNG